MEAVKTLNGAMKLPGVRRAAAAAGKKKGRRATTMADRVCVFLELSAGVLRFFRLIIFIIIILFYFFAYRCDQVFVRSGKKVRRPR